MFAELKAQLEEVEGKVKGAFGAVNARLEQLEVEVNTIDQPVQGAFDRLGALVATTQGAIDARAAATRALIQRLVA